MDCKHAICLCTMIFLGWSSVECCRGQPSERVVSRFLRLNSWKQTQCGISSCLGPSKPHCLQAKLSGRWRSVVHHHDPGRGFLWSFHVLVMSFCLLEMLACRPVCHRCSFSGWGPLSSSRRGTSSSPGFARNCSQNHRSSGFCEVDKVASL